MTHSFPSRRSSDLVYYLHDANAPYVSNAEWKALAAEYRHEPKMALAAGDDGMDVVARILGSAARHLTNAGWLVCEVGGSVAEFEARWPALPVTWIEFEHRSEEPTSELQSLM